MNPQRPDWVSFTLAFAVGLLIHPLGALLLATSILLLITLFRKP